MKKLLFFMRTILPLKITNPQHPEKVIYAKSNTYKISGKIPKPFLHRVISLLMIQV